jgi:hypothetical protein
VELEAVRRVPVGDLRLQVGGQVDDVDGAERALLDTDTTSNTQAFRNERDLGLRGNLDAKLSSPDDWTRLLALLPTFLQRYEPSLYRR